MLEAAKRRSLLGPGPVAPQIEHAVGFGQAAGGPPAGLALDLGSGGGIPGLVLAVEWPDSRWVLVDGRARSAGFLREAVAELGLEARVTVREARAEVAGHDLALRGRVALVVARGVGGPAVTAECAAGFLAVGGTLVVSEPPESSGSRWPAEGIAALGLGPAVVVESSAGGYRYAVLSQVTPCPDRFPRRVGIPGKRPLF